MMDFSRYVFKSREDNEEICEQWITKKIQVVVSATYAKAIISRIWYKANKKQNKLSQKI